MFGRSSGWSLGSLILILTGLAAFGGVQGADAQNKNAGSRTARPLITHQIDSGQMVTLDGNVRRDLRPEHDLGPVEDNLALRLYLILKRTPEQQAAMDNLLARQQQPGAAEYHQWLTPPQVGERFGASEEDIAKITSWLAGQGLRVNSVLNNASFIDFSATAGQVRATFHTQLHYYNVQGGKYPANAEEPMIPAALAPAVAGLEGLVKIPRRMNHTAARQAAYDPSRHRWHDNAPGVPSASPALSAGGGYYVTPQDSYTIYNVNKVFNSGNLAANATVAVIEQSDFEYGSVNAATNLASGGDVNTFRSLFGVAGTLNMHVYHGYGTVSCNAPGIDPNGNGEEEEAALDAEWANALAPAANLIFMSCDQSPDGGINSSMMALIDNNLADSMSLSYGESELAFTASNFAFYDALFAQAALQGQSIFVSAGDSGSDVADNGAAVATSGMNVSGFGSPNVTMAGGTDFQDLYDFNQGGAPQSNYWGANSAYLGSALSYVPETVWNDSCASSIIANQNGYAGAGYCATGSDLLHEVVGGSGGFSIHYAVPPYQSAITGYAGTQRAQPDISGFAADGSWLHALIFCDSHQASLTCSSSGGSSTVAVAGGTSFVAPYLAGVAGLLVNSTGSRQGVWNPTLYALGQAQFTGSASSSACYANGQTSNIGVTTGLPAANCIFNDVTTGNNDVPCFFLGSSNCYLDGVFGILSVTRSPLTVAYPAAPGYDEATGIGTVNVYNLISNWNTAFSSGTTLTAQPTTLSSGQSTTLTATVTSGTPQGYVDAPPALSGSITFSASGIAAPLGACALSGLSQNTGSCSIMVGSASLNPGANLISATFSGSGTYPPSTSNLVTVSTPVSLGLPQTITFNPIASQTLGVSLTLAATASSGLPVSYASATTNVCTVSGSVASLIGLGACAITASQPGNGVYSAAAPVTQTFDVVSSGATYLGSDTTTQGTWLGQYGTDGELIANQPANAPAYASVTLGGDSVYTWASATSDVRALQTSATSRIASTFYSASSFKINVNMGGGGAHRLALYLLDWDSTGRAETIAILDAATNTALDTRTFAGFHNGEYVSWNLQGNVTIQVTRTGSANGVVAGIFFDPVRPPALANYNGFDTTTQGAWTAFYGGDGELLANAANIVPAYAKVSLSGSSAFTWASSTSDPRALQTAGGSAARIAATYYSSAGFTINVNLTDGNTHQLSLYLVDWDSSIRAETISLVDVYTNHVLDTESFSNFHGGQYVSWNVKGHVLIQVTRTGGPNAVVSGIFFDPAASGAAASFIGVDTATQGSWTGNYGSSGYSIADDAANLPAFAALKFSAASQYQWANPTADVRALQTARASSTRIASAYYSATGFTIDLNLTGGATHKISLYLLDWDTNARAETVSILNGDDNTALDSRSFSGFHNGEYAAWNVKGHVLIQVTKTAGGNAVVSGVFID